MNDLHRRRPLGQQHTDTVYLPGDEPPATEPGPQRAAAGATSMSRPVVTDENETVVQFEDDKADRLGRRHFSAYWLADNVGPGCDENGVRGQVFVANVDAFVARHRSRGRTVRFEDRKAERS